MSIRNYFDLSEPVTFRARKSPPPAVGAATPVRTSAPSQVLALPWQIATYCILLFAIVASRYLDLYRVGLVSEFKLDLPYLLFLVIASLLAFPVVYDKARLNKDQPILLQICLVFTAGMGWEKIVATAIGR